MTDTVNLGLPCIEVSQAQKHVTHNDALRILDTLVQLAVLDRDLTAPPGLPSEGQRWIVKTGATGAWAGHVDAIAAWQDGAWQFSTPQTGWTAFVIDEGTLLVWNGSAWGDFFSTVTAIQNLAMLGIGTTADGGNPLSAKLNNSLFAAKTVAEGGDGHLRYKLSKEAAAKTLSFLFQNNYSGRAEIGLTGDDDFHFKVSPDGSSWAEALTIDRSSGGVRFLANETDLASAATCDVGSQQSLEVNITGTTTITSFGTVANAISLVKFAGALTLTHNATSLILPGAANITTAAGDTAIATSDSSGNWRVRHYQRASGVLPSSTTSNGVPRFNGTTGGIKTSAMTVSDDAIIESVGLRHTLVALADDTATSINIPGGIGAFGVITIRNLNPGPTAPMGIFFCRGNVAAAPVPLVWSDATAVAYAATSLSGTTGTDGKLTLAANNDGKLWVENRLGASRNVCITFLSPV